MKKIRFLLLACVAVAVNGASVLAQDGVAQSADEVLSQPTPPAAAAPEKAEEKKEDSVAKKELEDPEILKKKLALAKKMHEIRPTGDQVRSAVERAAGGLPDYERQPFIAAMNGVLNYNAIERISMDAMIEVYTLAELEVMVDYYSKPEAISASEKMDDWAAKVQPEISRLIDKAIIRVRTGGE